ncbi:hypothetical protein E5676_scaffold403G00490 [Cucumis melo var. makuwa]|uniref:Uncharacterized protein n=1 Tax=Cucumis melo var. makuwa TaxID=1194695 RepID=A0A5D3DZ39_CUCMM|nr:hypothetical protein E5676_scaffold403G00490 [Cucumis melo var. makuwa]
MHWTMTDEGQVTMGGVGSGVLRERKEKGKETIREREGIDRGEKGKQTWKRERKRRFLDPYPEQSSNLRS